MADEKLEIDILINAADSAKSVKDLKQSIRDLENAAIEAGVSGNDNLAKKYAAAAGEAKDKIGDLKAEISSLGGAAEKLGAVANVGASIAGGFAAAQGAAALFGSSQEEVEKQLLKVQAATAILQGVQQVSQLSEQANILKTIALRQLDVVNVKLQTAAEEGGIVTRYAAAAAQKALNAIMAANPFALVLVAVTALVAGYKLLSSSVDETAEATAKANDTILASNKKRYENEIEYQKALGKNTTELEIQQEKALIAQELRNVRYLQGLKTRTEEQDKSLQDNLAALEESTQKIRVLDATRQKEQEDAKLKADEELAKKREKEIADKQAHDAKLIEEDKKKRAALLGELTTMESIGTAQIMKRTEVEIAERDKRMMAAAFENGEKVRLDYEEQLNRDEWLKMDAERAQKESDIKKQVAQNAINAKIAERNAALQVGTDLVNSAVSIGSVLIKDKKKLESFNKKAALIQIGIDSGKAIAGVIAAAASTSLTPADMAAKIATGTATVLTNIAKAKKLLSGDSGSAPSLGGSAGTASNISTDTGTRNINVGASSVRQPTIGGGVGRGSGAPSLPTAAKDCNCPELGFGNTQLDEFGRPVQVVKAYVVEQEMTNKQNVFKGQKERATL